MKAWQSPRHMKVNGVMSLVFGRLPRDFQSNTHKAMILEVISLSVSKSEAVKTDKGLSLAHKPPFKSAPPKQLLG
ncbi:hypothetical protein NP590_10005 [Methylomonas sp. SURF-2]|uniref:Uncharacterized protein n=1 Tax=Methylomonas subterranea TaxID=2952225 RepID=A0ABT1TG55_9GAMM|nr:hypothetical protein [Methylomonas sp. SURF-2]MCQ8104435.1 hypothetical protein [Methylomonas sp. SURF-2]